MKRMPFHTTALLRRFAAGFFLVAGMLSCSAPQATFTNPLRDGVSPSQPQRFLVTAPTRGSPNTTGAITPASNQDAASP